MMVQRKLLNELRNEGLPGRGERKRDGAGNEIRTRDFNLGKVALYH